MPQKAKLFKLLLRHAGGGGGIGKSEGRKGRSRREAGGRGREGTLFIVRRMEGKDSRKKEGGIERANVFASHEIKTEGGILALRILHHSEGFNAEIAGTFPGRAESCARQFPPSHFCSQSRLLITYRSYRGKYCVRNFQSGGIDIIDNAQNVAAISQFAEEFNGIRAVDEPRPSRLPTCRTRCCV